MDQAPVLPPAGPGICNIRHGQIRHFQQAVIRREERSSLGHLPQLPVEALGRVGRIDRAAYRAVGSDLFYIKGVFVIPIGLTLFGPPAQPGGFAGQKERRRTFRAAPLRLWFGAVLI